MHTMGGRRGYSEGLLVWDLIGLERTRLADSCRSASELCGEKADGFLPTQLDCLGRHRRFPKAAIGPPSSNFGLECGLRENLGPSRNCGTISYAAAI